MIFRLLEFHLPKFRFRPFFYIFATSILVSSAVESRIFGATESQTHGECPDECCSQPDVWLVNTRGMSCPQGRCGVHRDFPLFALRNNNWHKKTKDQFITTLTSDTIVCVFIDGNRIDRNEAVQRGQKIRRMIGFSGRPLRFVIWSWPSDKIRGPVRDAKVKIARADHESYYLASWLSAIPGNQPTSLMGYSLGARIVTSSTHMLSGARFQGNSIGVAGLEQRVHPRLILLGAATPLHWLAPGQANGLALSQAEKSLSILNSKDRALKWLPLVTETRKQPVIGYRPMSQRCLAGHLQQCDVAEKMGNSHDIDDYTRYGLNLIRSYALFVN